jgi:8-oxo-dGTP pyrophosphatase MutT (NUDIX family)
MMKEVDKIAFIELQNGAILSTRSRGKTKFYLPGGKRESGETDEQTLVREIAEELNVRIDPETIEYLGTFKAQSDGAKTGVLVKMTCYTAKFTGIIEASSEIDEIQWLHYKDLDIISEVDKLIFKFLHDRGKLR